jgi:ribonuclease HI
MNDADEFIIHTDGGARGNPGPAAYAFVIERPDRPAFEEKAYLGQTTNNIAEYTGLVKALERAKNLGARRVVVYSDSELMVRQMTGQYKVKNEGLIPLYRQAAAFSRGFESFAIHHVRREQNKHADRLCNEALDQPDAYRAPVAGVPTPPKVTAPTVAPTMTAGPGSGDDVRLHAVEVLTEAAQLWSQGDPSFPAPARVWDELWKLLVKAKVVKRKKDPSGK